MDETSAHLCVIQDVVELNAIRLLATSSRKLLTRLIGGRLDHHPQELLRFFEEGFEGAHLRPEQMRRPHHPSMHEYYRKPADD